MKETHISIEQIYMSFSGHIKNFLNTSTQ